MTTRMHLQHTYDRLVNADIEDVWRAITDPDDVQQSWYDTTVESTWMPGEPVRWLDEDETCLCEGQVIDVDAPHRLVHTFAYTSHGPSGAGGDAPTRVTWSLEPSDDGTLVNLVHDGFASETATWRAVEDSWETVLDGLVELFGDDVRSED